MPSGRKPDGDAALSNAERQARYRLRHQVEQPAPGAARIGLPTAAAARGVGTMPSPSCLRRRPSAPPGSKRCPTRFRYGDC